MDVSVQNSGGGSSLRVLQAGRGIAALLVLLHHCATGIVGLPRYWGVDPTGGAFKFGGAAGVEFFFVLSGFIIAYVHGGDVGRPERAPRYLLRRLLRIYPIYWFVLAGLVPIYFIAPKLGLGFERNPLDILSSFTLIHHGIDRTILPAAWTLYHELLFYLLFLVAIWNRSFGIAVLGGWWLLSLAAVITGPWSFPIVFYSSPLHLLFGFGMLSCGLVRRAQLPIPGLLAVLGAVLFFGAGLLENRGWVLANRDAQALIYGAGSALMVTGLVRLEQLQRLPIPPLLTALGDASYSIYLIHFPVMSLLAKLIFALHLGSMLPGWAGFLIIALSAALIGLAFYRYVEAPLLKHLNRRFLPRRKAGPATGDV